MTPCKLTAAIIAREVALASLDDAKGRGDTQAMKRGYEAVRAATLAVMVEEERYGKEKGSGSV